MNQTIRHTRGPQGSTFEVIAAVCGVCGRTAAVRAGKLAAHDASHCNGSHVTWKNCSGSGRQVVFDVIDVQAAALAKAEAKCDALAIELDALKAVPS